MPPCDFFRVSIVNSSNIILPVVDLRNFLITIQKKKHLSRSLYGLGMSPLVNKTLFISMRYLLSFILTFLITLPNCGMVFSGTMNKMLPLINKEMPFVMMSNDGTLSSGSGSIESELYNCCPNAYNNILERDIAPLQTVEDVSTFTHIGNSPLENYLIADIEDSPCSLYRPDSPPDPSEYCSLIGHSVKHLD